MDQKLFSALYIDRPLNPPGDRSIAKYSLQTASMKESNRTMKQENKKTRGKEVGVLTTETSRLVTRLPVSNLACEQALHLGISWKVDAREETGGPLARAFLRGLLRPPK